MALIRCPECGKEISDKAPHCIHCGCPMEEILRVRDIDSNQLNATQQEESTAPSSDSTSYQITLRSTGPNKIALIALIRQITGCGLKEAKDITDTLPSIIKKDLTMQQAEKIQQDMADLGAQATIETPKRPAVTDNRNSAVNTDSNNKDTYAVVVTKTHGMLLMPLAVILSKYNKAEPKELVPFLNQLPAVLLNNLSQDEAFRVVNSNTAYNVQLTVMKDPATYHMPKMPRCSDGIAEDSGAIRCPHCGSTAVTTGQRGYTLTTGFLGSNKTMNRCAKCGHKWTPSRWD